MAVAVVATNQLEVAELMQDWGIYYRQLPLAAEENSEESIESTDTSNN